MTDVRNILILLLLGAASTSQAQSVRLREKASVTGREVRLADVAVTSDLPAEADRIVVATLSATRRSGRVRIDQIENALASANINPATISFSGAFRCRVSVTAKPIAKPAPVAARPAAATADAKVESPTPVVVAKAKTIGDMIIEQLAASLAVPTDQIEVAFDKRSDETVAMAMNDTITITSSDRKELGRRHWRIDHTENKRAYRRYISARVSVNRKALLAVRRLDRGTVVSADDVRLADYADEGKQMLLTDTDLAIGQQVRRPIEAGTPIDPDDLTAPLLVKRGQTVWVTCGVVRVPAEATEPGCKGDLIELVNTLSKKRIRATVIGPAMASMAMAPTAKENCQ